MYCLGIFNGRLAGAAGLLQVLVYLRRKAWSPRFAGFFVPAGVAFQQTDFALTAH